ncbi:fatty acid synthase-like [Pectinophora gossypiella]|uniref:fatty acid synthase-like n=1 Tax=Pectinophora gossypiella TaxID=13191 RepID=UPI00214E1183|nr:fatty acid synthase-like [Pectinophora gossypiella]
MAPTPQELGGQDKPRCGTTPRPPPGEEVVISGISGVFPSSKNTTQFAENLFNQVDMVTETDLNFHHPEAPKHFGKVDGVKKFDAQFFRVTYSHALSMEPMSRMLLEQAYQAMYDSGINPLAYKGKKVGVFVGSSYSDTSNVAMFSSYKQKGFVLSGCGKSMFSNRISYWIDAKGPSYTLDCACASSMVCLEHAYNAMTKGECEAAVIGGCNLCFEPHLGLNLRKSGLVSKDGRTKCFDKHGDGPVRSEAITCLFLQKAKDARRVYAEVYYAQVTYGLKEDAQFLPLRRSQDLEHLFKKFYSEIDVSPKEVEYVEADGSAIAESDTNELIAISNTFVNDRPVKIGSVKSNMGNSEPASGLCALTKVCLAYHEGKLPGNLHYSEPVDVPALKNRKLEVVQDNASFGRGYTAVNNFSINGTNCHVLLKGHFKPKDTSKYKSNIPRLVLISGRQEACVEKIINILKSQPIDPEVIGMMHNIYKIDTPGHTCRGYTILDTNENNETISLKDSAEHYPGLKRPLWLVFSGMGSQWPGMAADLMRIPAFAGAIYKCHTALKPLGVDLIRVLTEPDKTIFDNILNCFIGISAVQIGLTDVLKELGIVPDYVIGHSQGEMGCAYFDDCFTTEDMILAAYSRGIVSVETSFVKGAMAAVGMGYKDIFPLCPPEIDVACHNSSESATLSGPADVLKEFVAELTAKGIFAREVPSANIPFHSRYIAHAGPAFKQRLGAIIKKPKLRSEKWICTSVPQDKWDEPLAKYSSADYHTNNLMSPVYFEEASKLIPDNAVVVEVAPHGLLQAILKRSHPECTHIPLTRRGTTEQIKFLFEAFGKLYQEGYNFQMDALYPKIEYPVATETQMLSHYVDWEHSEEWPEVVVHNNDKITTATRELVMSVHDDEYKYISEYIREGNNVFPESAMLFLVWETLAMYMGVNYKELSVVFREVQFHGEAIIQPEEAFKININISKGNDYFEVSQYGITLANGYVSEIVKPKFIPLKDVEQNDEDVNLTSDDVYKHLHAKGLTYKGEFQSVIKTNFRRTQAQIKWNDNWITFLDALIQLNILSRDYDGVTKPKIIKKITISIDDFKKVTENNYEDYYDAQLYSIYEVTRCAGVEFRNIIFEDKPIQKQEPDVLESISFVPHSITGKVNIETALQINLQIIADNAHDEVINVTEVVTKTNSVLSYVLERVADNIANINIKVNTVDIEKVNQAIEKSSVVVIQDTFNEKVTNNILNKIRKNAFIMAFVENIHTFKNGVFTVVSSMSVQSKNLLLLKKTGSNNDVTCISIVSDEKFAWIPIVQSELQKTKRVVLISERQPHCGLFGIVKKLRKEHPNKISLFLIDDYCAPTFDKENPVFKQQLQKNLTFNVFHKDQWGSYYYLPHSGSAIVQNIKLVNAVPGDTDSLKWAETPAIPANNNLVQICYAGPSIRDSQKAVGIVHDSTCDFGMDFSGLDTNGDRVMGVVPGGALGSTVKADPHLLWPVPEHWSLEEAATVPLPYAHAFYCLVVKGQLLKGQSVFVNGGAGALGQAIISICLALGCTIYTSVSNPHKKQFLLKLFPQIDARNIGCSINGDFRNMVILNTKGRRCDFVINCASGASREAAMKCVAVCGIFLDISQYDMKQNKPIGMSYVEGERNYLAANFSTIFKPENVNEKKMLQIIIAQGIVNGTVRPLSRIVYPTTDVSRAFRLLSANKHRGRVLIRIKDAEVPTKCLNVIPRMTFSSNGTYIVVCDETELGIELANRLVRRGARKLLLHLKSKQVSGYIHLKLESWSKLGTSVKISTEKLHSDKNCVQLLNDAEKMGRVQGIFIIQETSSLLESSLKQQEFAEKYESVTKVVANLDVLSRNNCPELSAFVVVSRSSQNIVDEYVASVSDKICQARLGVGLPALAFKVELLDELTSQDQYDTSLQPQNIATVLNALETSLRQKNGSVITYNLKTKRNLEFLEKVSRCLGVKNIIEIDETLTVNNFITSDVNIEELKSIIKDTYKIEFSVEKLKILSIASIKSLCETSKKINKVDSGLGAFYTFVEADEYVATDVMIPMRTIIDKYNETQELDEKAAHLMLIPGFEGHHQIFKPICERLKIRAITFQLGPDLITESIQDMALSILKYIKKTFVFESKFYLLGYSFGVNVALETAALLEKEGRVGVVYCLDSSPDALKVQLEAHIGNLTDNEIQTFVIEHMFELMTGSKNDELSKELNILEEWSDKVDVCVKKLRGLVTYTTEYIKTVLESAYRRIQLARDYKPELKLESELILMKGIPHPNANTLEHDYNLSKYSTKPVKVFEIASNHATATQDCRVANIVNKLLDPKLLEEFKNKNLCETYFADC